VIFFIDLPQNIQLHDEELSIYCCMNFLFIVLRGFFSQKKHDWENADTIKSDSFENLRAILRCGAKIASFLVRRSHSKSDRLTIS